MPVLEELDSFMPIATRLTQRSALRSAQHQV